MVRNLTEARSPNSNMDSAASGYTTVYPTVLNGLTILSTDRGSAAWTWETNSAFSVIADYGVALKGQGKRTRFQARTLPRIGNGMLWTDATVPQQHGLMKAPEPLKFKPRFNPFEDDEPVQTRRPILCPKMAEFLLTESFNPNPFPDYGQWDEEKAMLAALMPRGGNATDNGPIIYQPRPVSYKDYNATLRNILEFDFDAAENDDVDGAYQRADATEAPVAVQHSLSPDSDGYTSDSSRLFDVSTNTSAETTPDKLEALLKVSPFDVERVANMDARGRLPDIKGLGLHTPQFKPTPLKEGTTALDLLKAIQVGGDLPFRAPSPPTKVLPAPFKENTTALDLLNTIQGSFSLPFLAPPKESKEHGGPSILRGAYALIGESLSLSGSAISSSFPDLDEDDMDERAILGSLLT